MQQALRSHATVGVALACASMITISPLAYSSDIERAPSAVVSGVVGLAASDGYLDLSENLQTPAGLEEAFDMFAGGQAQEGLGDLYPLFAPLLVLVESTVLAFQGIFAAIGSGNPLNLLRAILDFPALVIVPPLVVLITHLIGGGDSAGAGAGLAADGLDSTVGSLGLDDTVGQLSNLITPLLDDLGSIPAALATDVGLDMAIF